MLFRKVNTSSCVNSGELKAACLILFDTRVVTNKFVSWSDCPVNTEGRDVIMKDTFGYILLSLSVSLSVRLLPSHFSLSLFHLHSSLFLFSFSVCVSFRVFVVLFSYTHLVFFLSFTLSFILCFLSYPPIYSHFHTFLLFI